MRLAAGARLTSAAMVLIFAAAAPLAAAQGNVMDNFPNACRDVDPMDAVAHGRGDPLTVIVNGESIEPDFIETGVAEATQVGEGKNGDRVAFLNVSVPDEDDPIVTALLIAGRVDLDVDNATEGLEAEAWTNTRLAHLNVLNGLVTADLVRGFAYARADVRSGRTVTDPSTIVGLRVNGISVTDIAPGANITLPSSLFGEGSFVTVYERIDHSRMPTEDQPFYEADVRVRMLHVHITNMPLLGHVDVIASDSYSRAVAPTPFCGVAQTVEAGAYVARVREGLDDTEERHGVLVGEQHIGVTGGSGHQQLFGEDLRLLGAQVLVNVTETDVDGSIEAGVSSDSSARSQVLNVCVKLDETDGCFIDVQAVKATADCHADEAGADCVGHVEILRLIVDGVDVCEALGINGTCVPDTAGDEPTYNVGPIGIWLNQQERTSSDGYASLYVRAIRIETPLPAIETIIIGRAYASAGFEEAGTPTTVDTSWNL